MFADTKAYADLGEVVIKAAASKGTTNPLQGNKSSFSDTHAQADIDHARASAAARSPYYGAYFVLLGSIGTIWLLAVLQSIILASLIDIFFRVVDEASNLRYATVIIAVAFLSSAPFYSSLMMPDLFASVGVISALLIVFFWLKMGPVLRIYLSSLSLLAVVFHATHAPLIFLTIGSAVLLALLAKVKIPIRGILMICVILAFGPLGNWFFRFSAEKALGDEIYRPPFLTARLLEDGPGRSMLDTQCQKEQKFILCNFDFHRMTDSQAFLWERGTERSFFADADPSVRIALSRQDVPFAFETLRHDPLAVITSSIKNFWLLVFQYRLDDIGDASAVYRDPLFSQLSKYDLRGAECKSFPDLCAPRLPMIELGLFLALMNALTFMYLVGYLWQSGAKTAISLFALGLVLSVAFNDLICAAFSGAAPRYHTRMSWLIVLAACATFFQGKFYTVFRK